MRYVLLLVAAVITTVVETRMPPLSFTVWGIIIVVAFIVGLVMSHKPRMLILWIYLGFALGTAAAQVMVAR